MFEIRAYVNKFVTVYVVNSFYGVTDDSLVAVLFDT